MSEFFLHNEVFFVKIFHYFDSQNDLYVAKYEPIFISEPMKWYMQLFIHIERKKNFENYLKQNNTFAFLIYSRVQWLDQSNVAFVNFDYRFLIN